MAVKQTAAAKRKESVPTAYAAGLQFTTIYEYVFDTAYVAASDKIEMGLIPAGARIVSCRSIGENLGALTANVGLMSGEPGSTDNARVVGSELFAAQSVNTGAEGTATLLACKSIPKADTHRAIGATISADVAAAANKKLTLAVSYVF